LKNPSHGIRLPEAYVVGCEIEVREAGMNSAPSMVMGTTKGLEPIACIPATGRVGDMKLTCPPRLKVSDLEDPSRFHDRLIEWLMQQR
jgi:hypothetical protein